MPNSKRGVPNTHPNHFHTKHNPYRYRHVCLEMPNMNEKILIPSKSKDGKKSILDFLWAFLLEWNKTGIEILDMQIVKAALLLFEQVWLRGYSPERAGAEMVAQRIHHFVSSDGKGVYLDSEGTLWSHREAAEKLLNRLRRRNNWKEYQRAQHSSYKKLELPKAYAQVFATQSVQTVIASMILDNDAEAKKNSMQIFMYDTAFGKNVFNMMPSVIVGGSILDVIKEVELMLRSEKELVIQYAHDDTFTDVQVINGERCQILLGGDENSRFFRDLVEIHKNKQQGNHWMKKCNGEQIECWLTTYCSNIHGKREGSKAKYQLNNFSFIISYERCEMQAVHLDTRAPNENGFLVLTDGAVATKLFYNQGRKKLATYEDFMAYLEQIYGLTNRGGMYELENARNNSSTEVQEVEEILNGYGNCLLPYKACEEIKDSSEGLMQGSICILGGDQLHAGPACTQFRAVLFFSVNPPNGDPYNREVQYNGATLLGDVLLKLYNGLGLSGRLILVEEFLRRAGEFRDTEKHMRGEKYLGKSSHRMEKDSLCQC